MEIINMRTGSWGKLVAFFDVKTEEGFIIKGFKLFNGINGLFAGMPSEKRQDENGEDKYFDTIWLTDEIRESMREKLNTMASEQYNQNNTMSAGTDATMATPKSEQQPVPQTEKSDTQVEAPFSDDDLPF
tara:strand:+ start:7354 stop:7743 length:390 start_codon:yes stop_codon:yes gene_type:complete